MVNYATSKRFVNYRKERHSGLEAQVETQAERDILRVCSKSPLSSAEIALALGHKQLSGNLRKALPRLRERGLLVYTIPDKPTSSRQKYRLPDKGRAALEAGKEGKRLGQQ